MRWFKPVDTLFATIHTWWWVLSGAATLAMAIIGFAQGLPLYLTFCLTFVVLAASLCALYYGARLYVFVSERFTNRSDQIRIERQLIVLCC